MKPLWMPTGSVRAILALCVCGVLLAKLYATGLTGEEQLLLGGVLGGYGLSRKLETK